MPRRLLALLGLALALSLLPAAPAAASPRSDAKRLIALDDRLNGAVEAEGTATFERLMAEFERCGPAEGELDRARSDEVFGRMLNLMMRNMFAAIRDDLAVAAGRLDRFAPATSAIRRASRAMASVVRLSVELGAEPPDLCTYFGAWKQAGWDPQWHPDPAVPGLTAQQRAGIRSAHATMRRSGRALRRYGISRKRVKALVSNYDARMLLELPAL